MSLVVLVKVVADFTYCWSSTGRKSTDGPSLNITFASSNDPAGQKDWDKLSIFMSLLDKRTHFSIEYFSFSGPSSDRSQYGSIILEAICIFLRDIYECPDYPPANAIRWDLQTLTSATCHFQPSAAVRREITNNSEVLKFLPDTFQAVGNGAFSKTW